jgi:hypothetical protein
MNVSHEGVWLDMINYYTILVLALIFTPTLLHALPLI